VGLPQLPAPSPMIKVEEHKRELEIGLSRRRAVEQKDPGPR